MSRIEMCVRLRAVADDGTMAVEGIAVPWDTPVELGGRHEEFAPGSLRGGVGRAVRFGHVGDPDALAVPIGRISRVRDTDVGLWLRGELFDAPLSQQAWHTVRSGVVTGASVEFRAEGPAGRRTGLGRIEDAELVGVVLTERPVYDAARLTAVRARPRRPRFDAWTRWRDGRA